MNNYQAAAAAHNFAAPSASPHTTTRQGFPTTNSPGPTMDMYSSTATDNVGYVQATSPQPSGFPIAVSRAPLNYSPVSYRNTFNELFNYSLIKQNFHYRHTFLCRYFYVSSLLFYSLNVIYIHTYLNMDLCI